VAITQAVCNSFRVELMQGFHLFNSGGSAFKMALCRHRRISGQRQPPTHLRVRCLARGTTLEETCCQDRTRSCQAARPTLTSTTYSGHRRHGARGLILQQHKRKPCGVCLDFGADRVTSNSTFTVRFPTPSVTEAIIRIT
jgi:hypothetical protein